jgi:hypothetical protein
VKLSRKKIYLFFLFKGIFNFRRNPMTIFEIDYTLAECYRALGPAGKRLVQ